MEVVSANRSHSLCKQSRRYASGRKNYTGGRMCNRFLTTKIQSIPGYSIVCNSGFACDKPDRCIAYLVSSLKSFYKEFGIECSLPEMSGNFQLNVAALYNHICEHVPNKEWKVDCVKTKDRDKPFRFVVYEELDDFPYYTIWTVPIKKLQNCDEQTRQLLLLTFAMLHKEDMFQFPRESYDFQYSLGQMDCYSWGKEKLEVDMDAWDQWPDNFFEWAERYVLGDIYSLCDEIHSVEKETDDCHEKVLELVASLKKAGYSNLSLLMAIEDVAELCKKAWLTDYHVSMVKNIYGSDFSSKSEYEDGGIMDFCRLFPFCYDVDDPVVEYVIEMFNQCCGDMYSGVLMTHSFIDDPEVKLKMEYKYPFEWCKKIENLIDELK